MPVTMPRIYLSPPDISPQDHAAVDAVLTSNWVAPVGPHLEAFEAAVAERSGRAYAVALNSGTAALHLALQLLNVRPGDTVICPTLTFAASANPICYCGADPIFVDSEPDTWNMDPVLLELELGERAASGELPKAVIVVHLYGQCADMDPILAVCERYGIPVVEDAAEALGATYKGRPAGGMGAFSFFSFNGNKIITTSGGGMLLADKGSWIERARFLSTQAKEPVAHYEHREVGYNYRMSNVLAGLGLSQLDDLERRIAVKRAHFEAYREALGGLPGVAFMPIADPDAVNYWLSCLTIEPVKGGSSRDQVIAALADAAIEARPLWKPLHMQPVFQDCASIGGDCAEALFANGLCLPSGSSMSDEDRDKVIESVRSCFSQSQA
ncbi:MULTISPECIES: DegT/DnrJ/EryC1/StrS aminotransferase family protein [unclassified Lentimonas]|uniref:DegT/DnrJ/EryC1/StrS family aminotransferase n=2 Tax=unclassified Lentimonas TaxID=2630993 RepID=UPI0013209679|nr:MULTISPECIES: aminotransferase class I/II-fold pyridoxal phosphate-dependent enzyme [unclassified Lentimonas]CAA6683683.1 Lipopolysaccharide biosynthesis protein RffA [Lentimonas sp. CC6]CAA7169079.1 Lipopolysaccharide biosynthesis protein RffA [Lentimonas sp. CC21]CAA6678697.1 Lipopolysaccharide biosynthesis protein RffA [Lentimonas sp. CC4]CAA7074470.1 Lipopolysaccharide biosynthesis protein RffA [Lentimonas sp. CC4]CAA7180513.1 Lipopolysaccharide biosynthesis protein RffA [Lentimonas sp.